jgi:hypothetical protein
MITITHHPLIIFNCHRHLPNRYPSQLHLQKLSLFEIKCLGQPLIAILVFVQTE